MRLRRNIMDFRLFPPDLVAPVGLRLSLPVPTGMIGRRRKRVWDV